MSLVGFTVLHYGSLVDTAKTPHLRVSIHRDVACPRCRAPVNASCASPTGRSTRPHKERIKAGAL